MRHDMQIVPDIDQQKKAREDEFENVTHVGFHTELEQKLGNGNKNVLVIRGKQQQALTNVSARAPVIQRVSSDAQPLTAAELEVYTHRNMITACR